MINAGETVRISARPFDFDGIEDQQAQVQFTVDGETTALPMTYSGDRFVGEFTASSPGRHTVRIVAVLSDGSTSVETRTFNVV